MKVTMGLRVKNFNEQSIQNFNFTEKSEIETQFEITFPFASFPTIYNFNFCVNSSKIYGKVKTNPGQAENIPLLEKEQQKLYAKFQKSALDHLQNYSNFTLIALGGKRSGKSYSLFGINGVNGIFSLLVNDIFRHLLHFRPSQRDAEIDEIQTQMKVYDLLESSIIIRNEIYDSADNKESNFEITDNKLIISEDKEDEEFLVYFSATEIFQERPYDLLKNPTKNCRALKIGEIEGVGYFLENQVRIKVKSAVEIQVILNIAYKNKALLMNMNGGYQSNSSMIVKLEIFQKDPKNKTKKISNVFTFYELRSVDNSSDFVEDRLQSSYLNQKSLTALKNLFYQLSEKISEKSIEEVKKDSVYQQTLNKYSHFNTSLYQQTFQTSTIDSDEISQVRERLISQCTRQNLANIENEILNKIDFDSSVITKLLKNSFKNGSELLVLFHVSISKKKLSEAIETLTFAKNISEANIEQMNLLKQDESKFLKNLESQRQKLVQAISRPSKLERLSCIHKSKVFDTARNQESLNQQIKEIDYMLQTYDSKHFSESVRLSKVIKNENQSKNFRGLKNVDSNLLLNGKISYAFTANSEITVTKIPGSINSLILNGIFKDIDIAKNKIYINNVGVIENHCKISVKDSVVFLTAKSQYAAGNTFINGEELERFYVSDQKKYIKKLHHLDRVIIGTFHTFLVFDPFTNDPTHKGISEIEIDWDFCQYEKFEKQENVEKTKTENILKKNEQDLQMKAKKLHEDFEKSSKNLRSKMDEVEIQYAAEITKIEDKLQKKEYPKQVEDELDCLNQRKNRKLKELGQIKRTEALQFEEELRSLERETEMNSLYQIMNLNLEKKLIVCYGKIKEANQIAQHLNRKIEFHPFLETLNLFEAFHTHPDNPADTILKIKVVDGERKWCNLWSLEKFENRLVLFREEFDHFQKTREQLFTGKNDPFYDEKEFVLGAKGLIVLKNILYRFEVKPKIGLVSLFGNLGYINSVVSCVNENGANVNEEEMRKIVKQPTDLIDKSVCASFKITFEKLVIYDIEKFMNKNCYISMNVKTGLNIEQIRTFNFSIKDNETDMNWNSVVKILNPSKEVIDFYMNNQIQVSLMIDDFNLDELGITRKINSGNGWRRESWISADAFSNSDKNEKNSKKVPSKLCSLF